MRWLLPATLAALLSAVPSAMAHPPPILSGEQEKAHGQEIVGWRREMARIAASKDRKRVEQLYAPSFVHTDRKGVLTGAKERVAAVLAGEQLAELAPAENLVVRVPGGWTAVATGRSKIKAASESKTYVLAWTAVYVRAGQGWQLAALHETDIEERAP